MKHGNIEYSTGSDLALSANKTVNLDSTMTATEIQALIDAQPRNLGSYTLTFQFGDGTYTLTDSLDFFNFYGGGRLNIHGNQSDSTSLSTAQSVYLDFSGGASNGIYVNNCSCLVFIWHIIRSENLLNIYITTT